MTTFAPPSANAEQSAANPYENAPEVESAMQRALNDLLNAKQPSSEDWTLIPPGHAIEAFEALRDALPDKETGVRQVFKSLIRDNRWLVDLKNAPVPLRSGIEGEQTEEQIDSRFKIGKTGKKVIIRLTEGDIEALPDKEDLIKDILEKGTVSMIYGPAGTSKTFNAIHISYCIAHGISWFGHQTAQGKVWYINTEGGRGLKPRIAAWRKEYEQGKTSNIEFITWPVHLKEHSQELLDTIEEADEKPALLVVDNYSMCATGTNQNDQMEVTQTLIVLHKIAQTYGCHCLLVHHSNWTGKVNGSAAFRNHVDTMIDLSRPSKESPIILRCEKQRDAEAFQDIHIELKVVSPYAHPVTGEFITSCVVVPSDAPILDTLGSKQQQCLDLLANGMTFAEWYQIVKNDVNVSEKTLTRYRDLFIDKGLVVKDETQGKRPTYKHASHSKFSGHSDSYPLSEEIGEE